MRLTGRSLFQVSSTHGHLLSWSLLGRREAGRDRCGGRAGVKGLSEVDFPTVSGADASGKVQCLRLFTRPGKAAAPGVDSSDSVGEKLIGSHHRAGPKKNKIRITENSKFGMNLYVKNLKPTCILAKFN